MASFNEFKKAGKYITHADVPQPVIVTIAKFEQKDEKLYRSDETEKRLACYFREFGPDRYLKLTNTQLDDLGSMFGTMEAAIGRQVVLMATHVDVGGQTRNTLKVSPHIAQQPTQAPQPPQQPPAQYQTPEQPPQQPPSQHQPPVEFDDEPPF